MIPIRRIVLEHAHNIRDLGGYATPEQGMTKWNVLFRSDHLGALEANEWELLKQRNIKLILDLRSKQEVNSMSYDCSTYGIRYVSIPFMKMDVPLADSIPTSAKEDFLKSMKLDYKLMMRDIPEQIKAAFEQIALCLQGGGAVLFHCTAGKDRTGILATLLLDLCGVSEQDILADYQVSATYNQEGVHHILAKAMMERPEVKALFESTPAMMKPLIDYLHETSCEAYLLSIGVTEACLNTIKSICMIHS